MALNFTQSPATFLCAEDELRKMLRKTGTIGKGSDQRYLPQNNHSCFGNFPKGYNVPKQNVGTEF